MAKKPLFKPNFFVLASLLALSAQNLACARYFENEINSIHVGLTPNATGSVSFVELAWLAGYWKGVTPYPSGSPATTDGTSGTAPRSDTVTGSVGDDLVIPTPDQIHNFNQIYTRTVGGPDDPDIPNPTICQYIYQTQQMPTFSRSPDNSTHYLVNYIVSNVEATPNPINKDPGCATFISRQLTQATAGSLTVNFEFYQDSSSGNLMIVGVGDFESVPGQNSF